MAHVKRDRHDERGVRRVKDDRGAPATLIDSASFAVGRRPSDITDDDAKAIAAEVGSGLQRHSRVMVRIFIAGTTLVTLVLIIHVVDALWHGDAGGLFDRSMFGFTQLYFWGIVLWFTARSRRYARVKKAMLRHGRCPQCAYALTGLPGEDDGCTICPECGAAWRVEGAATT